MSLPHLILGLLSHGSLSGYDLNKTFQKTVQHFWTTDQSQVYRALYKLEENAWVEVETVIQTDSPNKKIYHITDGGRLALLDWLTTPLPDDTPHESWLGQIFFGGLVTEEAFSGLVQASITNLKERLAAMEALQISLAQYQDDPGVPRAAHFQFLTLDYGIQRHRFEIQWLEDMLLRVKTFPKT
jgi:PadR family transcriptional regulator, regulatory protein AphA